jgi:hypothetical protein
MKEILKQVVMNCEPVHEELYARLRLAYVDIFSPQRRERIGAVN